MSTGGGLGLALLSAFALNWGWVAQHGAARKLPELSARRPLQSLRSLFRDRLWLVGFSVGLGGWAFYVAALALAPLSLVQATSAGGIGVLAVLAHRRGERVTRAHWVGVAISVGGLALLGASLASGVGGGGHPSATRLAAWLGASALVALLAARGSSGAALGVSAGVLYAAGDVATKGATLGGAWLALIAIVLLAHGLAFAALQLGFQRGGALATAGTSTLLTNALPIVAGIALFGERLPAGAPGALRLIAFACVVWGAVLLSREATEPGARSRRTARGRRRDRRQTVPGQERRARRSRRRPGTPGPSTPPTLPDRLR